MLSPGQKGSAPEMVTAGLALIMVTGGEVPIQLWESVTVTVNTPVSTMMVVVVKEFDHRKVEYNEVESTPSVAGAVPQVNCGPVMTGVGVGYGFGTVNTVSRLHPLLYVILKESVPPAFIYELIVVSPLDHR